MFCRGCERFWRRLFTMRDVEHAVFSFDTKSGWVKVFFSCIFYVAVYYDSAAYD